MTDVKVSGPLFEGKVDVKAGMRDGMQAVVDIGASIVRRHLQMRPRGPAKYGHIADAVRTQIKVLAMGDLGGRISLGGPSRFLGPILEGGTHLPYKFPLGTEGSVVGSGARRRLRSARRVLAFHVGGGLVFRQSVMHPSIRAYRWRAQSEAELEPQVQGIIERAMAAHIA